MPLDGSPVLGYHGGMYTLQETFDMSCLALVEQGEPALKNEVCWYLTSDGRRCAAGHLMTCDPDTLHEMCGTVYEGSEASAHLVHHNLRLVRRLQRAHDGTARHSPKTWTVKWLERALEVAGEYDLDPSRVLEAARAKGWDVPADA